MAEKTGRCLCGAVTFKATLKNDQIGVCHCQTCRRGTAGPFFTVDCATFAFEKTDGLNVFNSSQWAERAFCGACGSPIAWRTKDHSVNIVSVNAFDDAAGLTLDHEVFIDEKPEYYSFAQKTTQLTGQQVFEMFAGNQEQT